MTMESLVMQLTGIHFYILNSKNHPQKLTEKRFNFHGVLGDAGDSFNIGFKSFYILKKKSEGKLRLKPGMSSLWLGIIVVTGNRHV